MNYPSIKTQGGAQPLFAEKDGFGPRATSERETVFSPCRLYRYTLWREWDRDSLGIQPVQIWQRGIQYVQWIGLNPSTADETNDDPTVRRCIAFSKAWGYGAMCMTNLFAWRATQPGLMMAAPEPAGLDNSLWLVRVAQTAGLVICAWGNHGTHLGQSVHVKRMLTDHGIKLHCLARTDAGEPRHPLYLPKTLTPIPL